MAARKATTRRVPNELKAIQDERLTCRHIKTLMQLQQITDENEELKSKLQFLEKEISSCQELHQIARDSESAMEKLDKDWRIMMEKSLSELRTKHEYKCRELLDAEKYARLSANKMQNEFENQIKQLENQVELLKKTLGINVNDKETIKELERDLAEAISKLEDAEKSADKMRLQLQESKTKENGYISERSRNNTEIANLERKLGELSLKLSREVESKKKLIEQSDLLKELEKQRLLIESLEKDKESHETNISELKSELKESEKRVHTLERENMIIQLERDALLQSSTDLRKEVEYLKEKEAGSKSSCSDFHEYVNVKRELVLLKEENTKLKNTSSRTEIKTLRAESTKSKRTIAKSTSASKRP